MQTLPLSRRDREIVPNKPSLIKQQIVVLPFQGQGIISGLKILMLLPDI